MRRVLAWVGGIIAALVLAWVVAHVVISPVNPRQEPPEKHYPAPCWACHLVTDAAELKLPGELTTTP